MHEKHYSLHFSQRLRQARKNAGLTQQQLAERVHIGQDTLSHYEQGHVLPPLLLLAQIAETLELDIHFLIPNSQDALWDEQHYTLLFKLSKLSPLELRYIQGFTQHLDQHPCLEHASREQHMNTLFQLQNLLAHDLRQRHVSLETLITFTSLALMGIELELRNHAQHIRRQEKSR